MSAISTVSGTRTQRAAYRQAPDLFVPSLNIKNLILNSTHRYAVDSFIRSFQCKLTLRSISSYRETEYDMTYLCW